ncbi:MAG: tetratricopeptide repeat protein [Kiritimatiellae bacterium]|nr:tetratricopeptide repeat protein [Kiritimatiellia bacterium]
MEEKNIYQQAPSEPEGPEPGYSVDLTMAEARRRTIRSIVLFVLGGALILGAVIMLILPGEKERDASDVSGAGMVAETSPESVKEKERTDLLSPELEAMARSAMEEGDQAIVRGTVNPQQVAEALVALRLARQYAASKDWARAEEHARDALRIYPSMNAALRLLGFIHLQRGQFDQAIVVLEQAQLGDPFNAETFNNLATAYLQRRDMEKAEELLLASLQIQPDYTLSYLNLGLLYLAKGEYQLALNQFEQALPNVANDDNVRNNIGVALLRLGRYAEARDHFQIIVNRNPGMAAAYFNIAITYVLEGDEKKAMEWIEDGGQYCSPSMLRQLLEDTDFDPIRQNERFQYVLRQLTPRVPAGPGSAK